MPKNFYIHSRELLRTMKLVEEVYEKKDLY